MGKGFNLAHTKVTISINLDGKIRVSQYNNIINNDFVNRLN